jgi:hypothetical protein
MNIDHDYYLSQFKYISQVKISIIQRKSSDDNDEEREKNDLQIRILQNFPNYYKIFYSNHNLKVIIQICVSRFFRC